MFKNIFTKFLDINQREIDRLAKIVANINAQEDIVKKLKTSEFAKKTSEYKKHLENGGDFESILPEAFALVREGSKRILGMRPFDVQLMASVALFEGKIVEQKTGEGKTLAAVPPLYLRALAGKGAHLVTVNDYLARRDAGWNAPLFKLLGLTTGSIIQETKSFIYDPDFNDPSHGDERLSHLKMCDRKTAYSADITYGTNNEFGFDYLRDNMVQNINQMSQRGHYFSIVDEVDSVLIDEARTPLIISAPDTDPTDKYYKFASLVEKLNPDTDFTIDEKMKSANLTEHGITRVEKILGVDNLYEKDFDAIHHIENALRAKTLFLKDRDYVVKEGQVTIVDEFTGRLMFGRRWSDGMHQAVEAKENVVIQQESKTLATISFQNYFRMYEHLSGMTGTASTEAEEFKKIYKLDVVVIPTNKEMVRKDLADVVFKTLRAKYTSIVKEIEERSVKNQPILIGTTSIEKNETLSSLLKRKGIAHNLLNAKNHEKEAEILSQAGKPGAVTVATNMAGRGVDIVLGGSKPSVPEGDERDEYMKSDKYKKEIEKWEESHEKVIKAGGLHVIGTERHESRRIDNQLRGRSGRQGDPGSSRFYLSLEDDLMRIFGGEQISAIMDRLKLPEDQPIENKLISRAIEQAQVKVEGFHFDARKSVVEYDDVANQQREVVYKLRRKILESENLTDEINEILHKQIEKIVAFSVSSEAGESDIDKIAVSFMEIVPFDEKSRAGLVKELSSRKSNDEKILLLEKVVSDIGKARKQQMGEELIREIEKYAYLSSIDKLWIDHIDSIEGLREGVRLRGYGQRDPLAEFKAEAFSMFESLMDRIDEEVSRRIFRIGVARRSPEIPLEMARTNEDQLDKTGLSDLGEDLTAKAGTPAFSPSSNLDNTDHRSLITDHQVKLGRNDPCPCGSGKKYKKCCYPKYG